MSSTIRGGLALDSASRSLSYLCSCGRRISIPLEDLVPDQQIDYHGCGGATISFTPELINDYRKKCGLPPL